MNRLKFLNASLDKASEDNERNYYKIINNQDEEVIVDGNNPLAGITLNFDVEILEVRDASEDEMAHGHVHGEGGCGHDH